MLIIYKRPDLARRNVRTGQPELMTASPTLSRLGRNMLLQAAALDKRVIECADAKSAFLQAEQGIGADPLFTKQVLNWRWHAPRIFWLGVDAKMRALGGRPRDR